MELEEMTSIQLAQEHYDTLVLLWELRDNERDNDSVDEGDVEDYLDAIRQEVKRRYPNSHRSIIQAWTRTFNRIRSESQ